LTAEQKIENIEKQIMACEQQRTNILTCPYCMRQNIEGEPLCCHPFARAVAAILLRKELHDKAEEAERIAEKVTRN
jgi:uncharacterized protein CbrC (UPF0167 family)